MNSDLMRFYDDVVGGESHTMWKPEKESVTTVRFLPGEEGEYAALETRYVHYNILDKGLIVSSKPVRKVVDSIWKIAKANGGQKWDLWEQVMHYQNGIVGKIGLSTETFANIVLVDQGRQVVWKMYKPSAKKLAAQASRSMEMAQKRGRKWDMLDPEEGFDVVVDYAPKSRKGADTWQVAIDSTPCPISLEGWQDGRQDLKTLAHGSCTELPDAEVVEILVSKYSKELESLGLPSIDELLGEV
jgi:hypothetical protein